MKSPRMNVDSPDTPAIRTAEPRVEVAWFSALCSDDYEFLGVPDGLAQQLRALFRNRATCG
jgi:hypothetical protein